MSGQTLKKTVEAAPWDFKFETSVAKDASGKPRVQIKTLLPVGLARGTAPVHPWAKGGLNFWLPEAFRMRHFILGEPRDETSRPLAGRPVPRAPRPHPPRARHVTRVRWAATRGAGAPGWPRGASDVTRAWARQPGRDGGAPGPASLLTVSSLLPLPGFGTIGILYWRLTQGTVGLREKSKYWNSNILGVHRSHASHH